MAIDTVEIILQPAFDTLARPVQFTVLGNSYTGPGIYDTRPANVPTEDGVIYSLYSITAAVNRGVESRA